MTRRPLPHLSIVFFAAMPLAAAVAFDATPYTKCTLPITGCNSNASCAVASGTCGTAGGAAFQAKEVYMIPFTKCQADTEGSCDDTTVSYRCSKDVYYTSLGWTLCHTVVCDYYQGATACAGQAGCTSCWK